MTGAVISGGIAAVEAVAGRVASMLSVARVSGGPRAAQALTPTALAMIGRSLIERGESLHAVKVRRSGGAVYLVPAQEAWTVWGGEDPEDWIIDATLTGAETVFRYVAPRDRHGSTSYGMLRRVTRGAACRRCIARRLPTRWQ